MPVKVIAAFGALPAMIDAWVLTRGRTTLTSMAPGWLLVLSSSDLRTSFEVCRCECAESLCCSALVPRGPAVLSRLFEADRGFRAPSGDDLANHVGARRVEGLVVVCRLRAVPFRSRRGLGPRLPALGRAGRGAPDGTPGRKLSSGSVFSRSPEPCERRARTRPARRLSGRDPCTCRPARWRSACSAPRPHPFTLLQAPAQQATAPKLHQCHSPRAPRRGAGGSSTPPCRGSAALSVLARPRRPRPSRSAAARDARHARAARRRAEPRSLVRRAA
jgi:hypothetical protein